MQLYQHDHPSTFRLVLHGSLEGAAVQELEHAWITASSVKGKAFVLDICGLTGVDENGKSLLARMRSSGVGVIDGPPPAPPNRWLGIPALRHRRKLR